MKNIKFFAAIVFLIICVGSLFGKSKLSVGSKAPDFTLLDEQGNVVSLSKLKGLVAIIFYPSIKTPYCKKEICGIDNNFSQLEKLGIRVIGISHSSSKTFRKKHPGFPLLYDKGKKVSKAYGANGLLFTKRITFLIKDGVIVGIIDNVNIKYHATQIRNGFLL